jgi:hypothetical protein
MIAFAKRIRAIIILQDIRSLVVLGFEPVGHHRLQALLMIDYRISFDDVTPFTVISVSTFINSGPG